MASLAQEAQVLCKLHIYMCVSSIRVSVAYPAEGHVYLL